MRTLYAWSHFTYRVFRISAKTKTKNADKAVTLEYLYTIYDFKNYLE